MYVCVFSYLHREKVQKRLVKGVQAWKNFWLQNFFFRHFCDQLGIIEKLSSPRVSCLGWAWTHPGWARRTHPGWAINQNAVIPAPEKLCNPGLFLRREKNETWAVRYPPFLSSLFLSSSAYGCSSPPAFLHLNLEDTSFYIVTRKNVKQRVNTFQIRLLRKGQ